MFLTSKSRKEGELILKNNLSPRILEHLAYLLLMLLFFAFSKPQFLQGLNCNCEIDTHYYTSGMGDLSQIMAKLSMKNINVFFVIER